MRVREERAGEDYNTLGASCRFDCPRLSCHCRRVSSLLSLLLLYPSLRIHSYSDRLPIDIIPLIFLLFMTCPRFLPRSVLVTQHSCTRSPLIIMRSSLAPHDKRLVVRLGTKSPSYFTLARAGKWGLFCRLCAVTTLARL